MNFDLDPETQELCDVVARFAARELAAPGGELDVEDFRRRWALTGKLGIVGGPVPTAYGGGGLSAVATAATMAALGQGSADTGFAFSVAAHLFAGLMPIVEFGTEEQKQRWLPALCGGERIAAHAITEPEAGSDTLGLRTTARRAGDHYVLDGDKCFTTNAPAADVFVVQARTRPGGGFFGLTAFLVDARNPGVHIGPQLAKVGLRGSPTADVHFDSCAVPVDDVLGGEGSGASVFSASMNWERTCLFAIYLGAMRRVLDSTLTYVGEREQFGRPIGDFQAVAHRVVDMTLQWESARLLLYRAAQGIDDGNADDVAPALAKIAVSEAAVQLGLDAVQLHGGLGVLDGAAESLLRDALPARIFSGTNEIQKNNVARSLGLSRGSRPAGRRH
jgi:alkylation response protein AidB-like acyl-CoA dehydrogenase